MTPDEGEPYLTDRHGRSLAEVKRELALAMDLAGRLDVIALRGRNTDARAVFGPQMYRRLQLSIETLHRVAERNASTAAAIEQAWLEEQEEEA